jgi:RNA polymerase sigma-70 factor (ECF subfamily)
MKPQDTSLGGERREFPQTLWDVLCRARDSDAGVRREGLEELCRQYWKPVYRYVRVAWVKTNEDAKDLTQAFFLWLTQGETLSRYDPERASFRAYLKSLLKHFVQHQEDALGRLKRGGGLRILNLDGLQDLVADPSSADPESIFDSAWRTALVADALVRVRERLQSQGRTLRLHVYEAYEFVDPAERPTYRDLARRFGITEKDVDNHLIALREEVRAEVRRELARLTLGPDGLEREWNALFGH